MQVIHQTEESRSAATDHANENQDGWTALIAASANGHKDVVKLLTDKGAKLDIQENVSIELLHA